MSFVKKIGVVVIFSAVLGLGLSLFAADPIAVHQWRIDGHINYSKTNTYLSVNVYSGGKTVPGLKVKMLGNLAEDHGNGKYTCFVQKPLVVPGQTLAVSFQQPGTAGQLAPVVTATIAVGPNTVIASPVNHARIAANSGQFIVSWHGGVAPYSLTVQKAEQPNDTVYGAQNLNGTSQAVPLAGFTPKHEYLVNLICKMGQFSFSAPVDGASDFYLVQRSNYVHLHVD
jgi:hypothetical protein